MGKLTSFTFVTLNGFYKGPGEDISWHKHSNAAAKFSNEASQSYNILLFGRKTYELMSSFWPTPAAAETYPLVAAKMNTAKKIVCSNTLKTTTWENSTIISGDIVTKLQQLKREDERDITILGSGSLITQLTNAGLIDSYMLMIDPLVMGKGTAVFDGIHHPMHLTLTASRIFEEEGIAVFTYEPVQPDEH